MLAAICALSAGSSPKLTTFLATRYGATQREGAFPGAVHLFADAFPHVFAAGHPLRAHTLSHFPLEFFAQADGHRLRVHFGSLMNYPENACKIFLASGH